MMLNKKNITIIVLIFFTIFGVFASVIAQTTQPNSTNTSTLTSKNSITGFLKKVVKSKEAVTKEIFTNFFSPQKGKSDFFGLLQALLLVFGLISLVFSVFMFMKKGIEVKEFFQQGGLGWVVLSIVIISIITNVNSPSGLFTNSLKNKPIITVLAYDFYLFNEKLTDRILLIGTGYKGDSSDIYQAVYTMADKVSAKKSVSNSLNNLQFFLVEVFLGFFLILLVLYTFLSNTVFSFIAALISFFIIIGLPFAFFKKTMDWYIETLKAIWGLIVLNILMGVVTAILLYFIAWQFGLTQPSAFIKLAINPTSQINILVSNFKSILSVVIMALVGIRMYGLMPAVAGMITGSSIGRLKL